MTVRSMTGFARATGGDERFTWVWEARSVNGKSLDVRLRLPSGWERLDALARPAAAQRFRRGNVSLTLDIKPVGGKTSLIVNEDFLTLLVSRCEEAGETPRIDRLLAVRGVLESAEEAEELGDDEARAKAIGETLYEVLDALAEARAEEGARIASVIEKQLEEIAALAAEARACADAQPSAIRDRLAVQIAELTEGKGGLDEDRIAQEAAVLAVKADVREELDRLDAHVEAARELVAADEAIGRRFDFLCQEFNREANTLASKSSALTLTRIGLNLKAAIDQMREQVQNIE